MLILYLCITFYCSAQERRKLNSTPDSKRWSKVIIKFNDNIYATLTVDVISKDSILIYSTLFNESKAPFYFYKPLLPDQSLLRESVFNFIVEDGEKINSQIRFIDSSNGNYFEGNRQLGCCVIPEVQESSFLTLHPNDSVNFSINISDFYEIKNEIQNGYKKFSVSYAAAFPIVNKEYKQLFEMDKQKGKKMKPVFYSIGMQKADKTDKYLYKRAYFVID